MVDRLDEIKERPEKATPRDIAWLIRQIENSRKILKALQDPRWEVVEAENGEWTIRERQFFRDPYLEEKQ